MKKEHTVLCVECRKETRYRIQNVSVKKCIKDKEYTFDVIEAICEECGEPVSIPGLMEYNAQEIDRQYREFEDIVSVDDINDLMAIYNIGKAPLSLSLGFGEITITRYLAGQIPSKEYSNVIRNALESPTFMLEKLNKNIEKIGETAYRKAIVAVNELQPLFALSEKMLLTISYIFNKAVEVTPLALQKMLYYIQAIYMVLYDIELFPEDCEAWAHGPVFRDVYEVFKNFKYNPIDDIRFAIFKNRFDELSDDERKVIELVVDSFGMYSGKTLELITHREAPWKEARTNCLPEEPSSEIILKESIKSFFEKINTEYSIDNVNGIKAYINSHLVAIG